MPPPITSVVMVSYYTGPVLFQAIASVLAQTEPVELCLVDNGNPPEITAQLQAMAEQESRLRFVTGHGNVGFSRGCNLGAKAAGGTHLLFLNPDSLLLPDALTRLQAHAAGLKRPFMIGARLLDEDGSDQRGCRRALLTPMTAFIEALCLHHFFPKARLNFNEEPIPSALTPIPAISGAFMFLTREDFWKITGFDEGYFLHVEDLDLCLRLRCAGGEIYFAPDVVVTHIGSTSRATRAFVEKHKARGFIRYFHKNFGKEYPKPFLWLLDLAIWVRTYLKIIAG
ncbi:MAG: glycosyltransferase family 2 protein [Alphaproteobacteria bacterium]|nr:glycosyltransferase family 2 protein [Alphaproteobacteria bacterium]